MQFSTGGRGRDQAVVTGWVLARGAHGVRTGLEDNVRIGRERLAGSNAELVGLAVEALGRHGRRAATPVEVGGMLGLK